MAKIANTKFFKSEDSAVLRTPGSGAKEFGGGGGFFPQLDHFLI